MSSVEVELADGWEYKRLQDIAKLNPRRPSYAGEDDALSVFFVPMAAVDEIQGQITAPETRQLGDVKGKSSRTFAANDVLFAKITPCMENGKSAVVPDDAGEFAFGSTEFHVIRGSESFCRNTFGGFCVRRRIGGTRRRT